jgi:hypothetical protein
LATRLHFEAPMDRRQLRACGATVSIFFAGCIDSVDSVGPAVLSCGDAGCGWEPVVTSSFQEGRAVYSSPIDILFVIDDTPAIAGIEPNLVAQYSLFAQVFQALPLGVPPMHVAFVPATLPSSDCSPPALRGAICNIAPPDQFLTVDYCGVNQSTSGSGRSQSHRGRRLRDGHQSFGMRFPGARATLSVVPAC